MGDQKQKDTIDMYPRLKLTQVNRQPAYVVVYDDCDVFPGAIMQVCDNIHAAREACREYIRESGEAWTGSEFFAATLRWNSQSPVDRRIFVWDGARNRRVPADVVVGELDRVSAAEVLALTNKI